MLTMQSARPIILSNFMLADLDLVRLERSPDILVTDGRIHFLPQDGRPDEAERVDLAGATLLPGLIDCHVHVLAHSLDLVANAVTPDSLMALRAAEAMGTLLRAGFTTVRDLGGADLGLVRGVEEGLIDGPNLVICGKGLSMTGGHYDLRARTDIRRDTLAARLGSLGMVVDGVENVRLACRRLLKEGARFIKIMANGGVASPNDPIDSLQYSDVCAAVTN